MSGMCEKCCIGIRRENQNKVRVEITGISPVWDQVIEKRSAKDRTAAERKNVAKATRRRRRILRAGFFFIFEELHRENER